MRAREPDHRGHVEHRGVKLGYEVTGDGDLTFLLLPTWTIVHSRVWKMQVPHLARRHRVVTFDGPGNGRSAAPLDPRAYDTTAMASAARAVLDATDTERAVLVSLSKGALWSLCLAATHPDRVLAQCFLSPSVPLTPQAPERAGIPNSFFDELDDPRGWQRYNAAYWRDHYRDFVEFFFDQCLPEPHSTKQHEDTVGWALETTPEVLIADALAEEPDGDTVASWCGDLDHPVVVVQGTDDRISPVSRSEALAEATGGRLVHIEGGGHLPQARDPVRVNLVLDELAQLLRPTPTRVVHRRGTRRPRRALWVSSPIGLGHARRDLAIARALRAHHPDLQVEWLAQPPVTQVLGEAGETVHPASHELASESAHMESESGEHDLHCFQAWRRMDEILLADFMVFHDVVGSRDYDLVVGDEAWEVDYFLHENPDLKRFAYAWATDFVGWLPMPEGGTAEGALTADYNAEMIEHVARHPRVRDLALFVGTPPDIVPDRFGPDLPSIREWTEQHYDFPGYITGFAPPTEDERAELRDALGYRPDERVVVVTVGGSGVGTYLLRRVLDAVPQARRRVPGLRVEVVAGPRIDPASLPSPAGATVHGYVPALHRHLAACDLAIVQGGLTTCMELTASRRPFVYVPLRRHFEQQLHVPHRLQRHGAGRRLDVDACDPDHLADVIAAELDRPVDVLDVDADGAERAASLLADLI